MELSFVAQQFELLAVNTVVKRPIPIPIAFALAFAAVMSFVILVPLFLPKARTTNGHPSCINFLRTIDSAKEQWALETKAVPGAAVSTNELMVYLKPPFPTCPQGGVIKIQPLGVYPVCSYPGHVVPEAIPVETNGAFSPGR